jgi:hypothetical protein
MSLEAQIISVKSFAKQVQTDYNIRVALARNVYITFDTKVQGVCFCVESGFAVHLKGGDLC